MSETISCRTPLICLTGGIATGKSRVGEWLAERRWTVICTDKIVHDLYGGDQPLAKEIATAFGPQMLLFDGSVDRVRLGERVFSDPAALQTLNTLVHPKVRVTWLKLAKGSIEKKRPTIVIIPLAYESGVTGEFQGTWVVACSSIKQHRRMRERGLNDEQIRQRLATQWPLQRKIDLADRVLWNDGDWSLTESQLELLHREIL